MLHVQLATVPGELPPDVELSLEALDSIHSHGGLPIGGISMPPPGTATMVRFEVPPHFTLRLVLRVGIDEAGVVVGPLRDNDRLALIGGVTLLVRGATPHVSYSGVVTHAQQTGDKCGVHCLGGQLVVDQCCATCTKNGATLKVCC